MPKGFAHLIILVSGILLISVVLGGVYFWSKPTNKLPPTKQIIVSPSPLPTPSPWNTYVNEQYGWQLTYPKEGVILTDQGYIEGECGKAILETGGTINIDNFFQVKIIPWAGLIADYLISKGAGNIYETEIITNSGANEGIYLVGLKKDFEVAVGYPPLLYVKYLFKKQNSLIIVSTLSHPVNLGGCINPNVIDPIKYAKYINPVWDQKNSFKFLQ